MPDSGKALVRSPTGVLSPPSTINVPNFQGDRTALIQGVALIALNDCSSKLQVTAPMTILIDFDPRVRSDP